jgi:hypothetical protein
MPDVVDEAAIDPDQGFFVYLYLGQDFWIIKNEKNLQYMYNKLILKKKYIINVCFSRMDSQSSPSKRILNPDPSESLLEKCTGS